MKRIVRGNDFKLRVPVMKIVDGAKVAFPLPGCTDIKVNVVNQYRRIALSYTIDVSEDNVLLARVEGDKVAVGTYALEVKGKLFGNDWRSNEYEQFQLVDNNAAGDTVFEPHEGEDSVEMDTALVVLAPAVELGNLIKDAEETIADTKEALKGVETKMGDIEQRADTAIGAATTAAERANTAAERAEQTNTAVKNAEKERVAAEQERKAAEEQRKSQMQSNAEAEQTRADAEQHRVEAEKRRASAETMRAAAEETRKTNEADRITGETSREKQEVSRVVAEQTRDEQETRRKAGEAQRADAENTRKRMEADRANAETERVAAEKARAAAETARADAETKRAAAETKRETDFSTKIAEVDTAVKNAKTATSEAEKVDATITDANVFEVTGRDGVKKSLDLASQADAATIKTELAGKVDKASVVQELGEAEDKVMSQKTVSDKLSDLTAIFNGETEVEVTTWSAKKISANSGVPSDNTSCLVSNPLPLSKVDGIYLNPQDGYEKYLGIQVFYYKDYNVVKASYLGYSSLSGGNINASVGKTESITTINGRYSNIFGAVDDAKYIVLQINNNKDPKHLPTDKTYLKAVTNYQEEGIISVLDKIKKEIETTKADERLTNLEDLTPNFDLNIPDELYTYVGSKLQIFKYPLTLLPNYRDYGVSISGINNNLHNTSNYGKYENTPRYFIFNASKAGDTYITITITDGNLNVLASKQVTIHIVAPTSPLEHKNVLIIGDSITQGVIDVRTGSEADVAYPDEVKRLLLSNEAESSILPAGLGLSNIQLIGSKNQTTGRQEGYSGWTADNFNGKNYGSQVSPFKIGGVIDYNAYLAQDSIYDDTTHKGVDIIYIMLGINNRGNFAAVDGKVKLDFSSAKTQLVQMLTYIKEQLRDDSSKEYYNPNLQVRLISYPYADTDCYDINMSSDDTKFKDGTILALQFKECTRINNEVAEMSEFKDWVSAICLSATIDSENGWNHAEIIKNPYMAEKETSSKSIHPNSVCYRMIGASIVRDIIGLIK